MKVGRWLLVISAVAAACKGASASEAERIRRQLHSADPAEVGHAMSSAENLRKREVQAGRSAPTGDQARLVADLRQLFATSKERSTRDFIAHIFIEAPLPGSLPEFLDCAQNELDSGTAVSCLEAIGAAHDLVNLHGLIDLFPSARRHDDGRLGVLWEVIATYGDAAIPDLAVVVKAADSKLRYDALWSLVCLASDAAASAALPAFKDADDNTRYLAVEAVRRHPGHDGELRLLLADPSLLVRRSVQDALGVPIDPAANGQPPERFHCRDDSGGTTR